MGSNDIQRKLGLRFRNLSLLDEALTHPSYLNENPGLVANSYQRLEFLGDAILGSVVALELFQRCVDLSEGQLTQLRSDLVRETSLAAIASRLDLGNDLNVGRGEEATGGRTRGSNLAASFEAVVGALFLDQGFRVAKAFVSRHMKEEIDVALEAGVTPDPKSRLQELVQAEGVASPIYRVVNLEGPEHDRIFTIDVMVDERVLGAGCGKRKLDAEQEAARQALRRLADPKSVT